MQIVLLHFCHVKVYNIICIAVTKTGFDPLKKAGNRVPEVLCPVQSFLSYSFPLQVPNATTHAMLCCPDAKEGLKL